MGRGGGGVATGLVCLLCTMLCTYAARILRIREGEGGILHIVKHVEYHRILKRYPSAEHPHPQAYAVRICVNTHNTV